MKWIIIVVLVCVIVFVLMAISGSKKRKEDKENEKCLTESNYLLIKDSPIVDALSTYTIHRNNNELRFTRKGKRYTLFYLKLEENKKVKLVGLDGYGIRDKEFLKYVCDLLKKIREQS